MKFVQNLQHRAQGKFHSITGGIKTINNQISLPGCKRTNINPNKVWETTRSCPGSFRRNKNNAICGDEIVNDNVCSINISPREVRRKSSCSLHQRHRSYPGACKTEIVVWSATSSSRSSLNSSTSSNKPPSISNSHLSVIWRNEVFEPGRDLDNISYIQNHKSNFSFLKNFINKKSHALLSIALFFTALYLIYALYITIHRSSRNRCDNKTTNNKING